MTHAHSPACAGLLAYCRAGFEKEVAAEIDEIAAEAGLVGFVRARPDTAFAAFELTAPASLADFAQWCDWRRPVFARQLLPWFARVDDLPERDRATPLVAAVKASGLRFSGLVLETPDTDEAKQRSGFCRRFQAPLAQALEKSGALKPARAEWPVLHVLFADATTVWLAVGLAGRAAPWPMGVPRLRLGREAPSRSALKLAEAFVTLLSEAEREAQLRPGLRAVDLGAAPGGWSWQLANRGLRVTAVDNGPMAASALATGLIEHVRADGFTWRPPRPVDWMVCDMVEQPGRVAALMAEWVGTGRCRRTIFNLKLPMKKRLDAVAQCRALIAKRLAREGAFDLRVKQLYHDREEVTAYLALRK